MNALIESRKLMFWGVLAAIALIGLLIAGTSKGKWVCKDGEWIAKGRVNTPKPLTFCR